MIYNQKLDAKLINIKKLKYYDLCTLITYKI